MSRFDYVKYDETAQARQAAFKGKCQELEALLNVWLPDDRAKALAMTKLEEFYAWCGKGIRDDQIARNGIAELQEVRNNE